ncbi:MAG: hypothetical protein AAF666_05675 [Pseudomonadota bacterium]
MIDHASSSQEPILASQADTEADDIITIARTRRVRTREAWVGWTQVLANILVPIALIVAGLNLYAQSVQGRLDASARQIELFYSPNLARAQIMLFAIWSDADLTVLRSPQKREFIDALVERSIATSGVNRNEIVMSVAALASYFDRVEACIDLGSCDEDELVQQVGGYARDFFCIYSVEINKIRDKSLVSSLGDGLEKFSQRAGGCISNN